MISILFGFLGAFLFTVMREAKFPAAQAKPGEVIKASDFRLVDGQGKVRARLAFSEEGTPGLWFFDEKGVARVNLGIYSDGTSYFGLQDAQGQMIELMRSFGPKEAH